MGTMIDLPDMRQSAKLALNGLTYRFTYVSLLR